VHVRKILISTAILLAPAALTTAAASAQPVLVTNQACYLVGQRVGIVGSGFAVSQPFQLAVDGVSLGTSTTNAGGGFSASVIPGGLGANIVQYPHALTATDGINSAKATFTVTRTTGARILASTGAAETLRAPFQVWGFDLVNDKPPADGSVARMPVYVHYLGPQKHLRTTIALGKTDGQCGYLRTPGRRVFPFKPSRGVWTLQVDSQPTYSPHPAGPVAKISVRVS
jgi:hypothetical protein